MQLEVKAEQFWAQMRSTTYLFNKSAITTDEQRARLKYELYHILGKRIITYPPTLKQYGFDHNTPYKMKKAVLKLDKKYDNSITSKEDRRFMKFLSNKTADGIKANWCWRIAQEAEQKQKDGWYPFFITLTVDPKRTDPEKLWREGREFRKYIRRLANVAAAQLGHPPPHKTPCKYHGADWPQTPESNYISYAAVIEHGKTQEHHHAHLMVWMREIPSMWKVDPNNGRLPQYRIQRECKHMRQYWPWSIASQCPALYFRTKGDIWSTLGHVTPIERETGIPIKINDVGAVGNYVTKYMQKGTKVWNHKMKCTRNLGLQKLKKVLNNLDNQTLEILSWRPQHSSHLLSVSSIHSVPQGLIRSLAKRRSFAIAYQSKCLDWKTVMKANYDHYRKMLMSVRRGARPERMPSAEFYDWVQQFLPETKGYSEEKLVEAHEKLKTAFPRNRHRVQPIVIGANEIGFTQCI